MILLTIACVISCGALQNSRNYKYAPTKLVNPLCFLQIHFKTAHSFLSIVNENDLFNT